MGGASVFRGAIVGALLVAGVAGPVAAQELDPLTFDPGSEITLADDTEVDLVSNLDETEAVTISVVLDDLPITGGGSVPGATVVLAPTGVTLEPDERVTLPVRVVLPDDLALTEPVSGHIEARAGGEAAAEVRITLPIPDEEAGAQPPTPAVEAWTVVQTFGEGVTGRDLPLEPAGEGVEVATPTAALGTLQDGEGRTLTVTGEVDDDELTLLFGAVARGTTYTGNIDLDPSDEAGVVALTVRSTDHPGLILLAVAVGLALAFLGRGFQDVMWPRRSLLKAIAKAARTAQAEQTKLTNEVSWTIEASVAHIETTGEAEAKAVPRAGLALDQTANAYAAAHRALAALQGAAGWADRAEAAHPALRGAVAGAPNTRAAALVEARVKLNTTTVEVAEVDDLLARAEWLTDLLKTAGELDTALDGRAEILEKLAGEPLPWPERRLVDAARRDLAAVRWHLNRVTSEEGIEQARVQDRIDAIDDTIAQMSATVDRLQRVFDAAKRAAVPATLPEVRRARPGAGDAERLVSMAARWLSRTSLATASLASVVLVIGTAFVVGVLTAYAALTTDEFGSLLDYLGAVGVGVAAATVVDGVGSALAAYTTTPAAPAEEAT